MDKHKRNSHQKTTIISTKTAHEWYTEAYNHLAEEPHKALECVDKALEIEPNHAEAHHIQGLALKHQGKHHEAIKSHDKAIAIKPNFHQAHYHKGTAFANLNENEAASKCFDKAIEIDPNFSQAYYGKANLEASLSKHREAIALFDKALSINPDFSQAYYDKGNSLAALKKTDEAIANFDKALKLDPKNKQAYYTKGIALVDMNRTDEALGFFTNGIDSDPNNALYYCGRARCLMNMGKRREAMKDFGKAQELIKTGKLSENLTKAQSKYIKDAVKSIVELQHMYEEIETNMKVLEKDHPMAKKFTAKVESLKEQSMNVSGKLMSHFGKDNENRVEVQKDQESYSTLKRNLRKEIDELKADIKHLNIEVKDLKDDVSGIHEELHTKLNDYKAKLDVELTKLELADHERAHVREYYRAFLETFSSTYVTSQIVDSGQLSLSTGSTMTSILSMVASYVPVIGDTLSSGITTIAAFLQTKEMITNARKMKGLAADSSELSQLVGKSGYEIVLHPVKQKKIIQVTDEDLEEKSESLLGKIREFCQKMEDKIDVYLYTRLYKTPQARLGHMDANKLIELWLNDKISPYTTEKVFIEKIVVEESVEVKTEVESDKGKEVTVTPAQHRTVCCNMF